MEFRVAPDTQVPGGHRGGDAAKAGGFRAVRDSDPMEVVVGNNDGDA